jgi:enamine deaminase RidA (YjgF/YER057c/UK114 family)
MDRCFSAHANIHTSMIAVAPGPDWTIEKVTIPGEAITASGYNPAVVANDFVFVAGNMALQRDGTLDPGVHVAPNRNWGGQTSFRRQVHYIVKQRLEPSLKAAGSSTASRRRPIFAGSRIFPISSTPGRSISATFPVR